METTRTGSIRAKVIPGLFTDYEGSWLSVFFYYKKVAILSYATCCIRRSVTSPNVPGITVSSYAWPAGPVCNAG